MIQIAPKTAYEMTYEEALLYCAFCNHNGYSDWRLPTQHEYEGGIGLTMSWYINRIIAHDTPTWHTTPIRDVK